jgi:hypothetical protein
MFVTGQILLNNYHEDVSFEDLGSRNHIKVELLICYDNEIETLNNAQISELFSSALWIELLKVNLIRL